MYVQIHAVRKHAESFPDWTPVAGSDPHAPAGTVDQPGAPGDHLLLEGLHVHILLTCGFEHHFVSRCGCSSCS